MVTSPLDFFSLHEKKYIAKRMKLSLRHDLNVIHLKITKMATCFALSHLRTLFVLLSYSKSPRIAFLRSVDHTPMLVRTFVLY